MKKLRDRQPWNPFPLACLTVEGLSPAAKTVLIYLGVRSNYNGETCVGHRKMCTELVRSKDFVTKGLAELEEKSYVKNSRRNHHKHQANWRTLNASLILKSRTGNQDQTLEISPEEQDQTSESSPDFGKSSPDQQGKTSQRDSNLPDTDLNLSDQTLNPVSKLVGQQASPPLPSVEAEATAAPQGEKPLRHESVPMQNQNPLEDWVGTGWKANARREFVEEMHLNLAPVYGLPMFDSEQTDAMVRLCQYRDALEWNIENITAMLKWARGHKFWKNRTQTFGSFVKHMGRTDETSMVAQYDAHTAKCVEDYENRKVELHEKCQEAEMVAEYRRKGYGR